MTKGSMIISLDCEGKWGMIDTLSAHHDEVITRSALTYAYDELTKLFKSYDVPVTFAFVMAFVLDASERNEFADYLVDYQFKGKSWLKNYTDAATSKKFDGWHFPEGLEMVRNNPAHEISCHSLRHSNFDQDHLQEADVELEMQGICAIAKKRQVDLKTFIFPRNKVGFLDQLCQNGFIGYRDKINTAKGLVRRMHSLASEFNVFEKSQPKTTTKKNEMVVIPSGYFFNWRFGARRCIPKALTVAKWKSAIDAACKSGEVVHLWFHPHNLIDGPTGLEVLADILRYATKRRDAGDLDILTQLDYCRNNDVSKK
jgi:hypothetical protein